TIRATDSGGAFIETSFRVTVNDTPTTSGITDVTVNESAPDTVVDLLAAFSDAEDLDSELTFTIEGNTNELLFSSAAIDAGSEELTLAYAADTPGVSDLTIRATDSGGAFIETTFRVTVNDTPETSGIGDIETMENAGDTLIDLFAAFSDAEDLDSELTFTVENVAEPNLFAATTVDAASGELRLELATHTFGESEITIRATDTSGAFIETTFHVNVAEAPNLDDIQASGRERGLDSSTLDSAQPALPLIANLAEPAEPVMTELSNERSEPRGSSADGDPEPAESPNEIPHVSSGPLEEVPNDDPGDRGAPLDVAVAPETTRVDTDTSSPPVDFWDEIDRLEEEIVAGPQDAEENENRVSRLIKQVGFGLSACVVALGTLVGIDRSKEGRKRRKHQLQGEDEQRRSRQASDSSDEPRSEGDA
ncbi:MAG: cadherin repeat domain-containing protein, partial [Myxococcales bacterium]|nr:cadherin repeat domain-containing protein [Myxococcales bacterium]